MDSVRSAEKSRQKNRRAFQDSNFENGEQKSPSRLYSVKNLEGIETGSKHWAVASEGFPPGLTVDELKNYARRKQLSHLRPRDNLKLEEGSLKLYKSEYKCRYLPFSLPKILTSNEEKTNQNSIPLIRPILFRPQNNLFILKEQPMESITEKNSNYIPFPNFERRKLLRRSTALKPEGEIATETEVRKEYVDYKTAVKAQLVRKLPSLKMEGDYEPLTTEQRDKFIAFLISQRPVLEKKKTSLKMEGSFDFQTEKNLNYVRHELNEKPRIRKRSTSLKLEGEVEFSPEYRNSFIDFPRSRPVTHKPIEKIFHQGGEFMNETETKTQFINFENVLISPSAKPENNLHMEGEMEIVPEYRNNFVNFPRERPFIRRPFNQLKPEGNLELLTGNSEKHFDTEEKENFHLMSDSNNFEEKLSFPVETTIDMQENSNNPVNKEQNSLIEKEVNLTYEKDHKPELIETADNTNTEREEKQILLSPNVKHPFIDFGKESSVRYSRDTKSQMSPRNRTPKGKMRLPVDSKKSNPESWKQSSTKRLKETTSEKALGEISKENSKQEKDTKEEAHAMKQNLRFASPTNPPSLFSQDFPAFKVLDVKGQVGCQSLVKDFLESEKSTSDEESLTYRLEVSNSGQRSPGFYKENSKIFPSLNLDRKTLEEAELRAKQRGAENFVKIVKSPEIPNSLLTQNRDLENRWKVSEKLNSEWFLSPAENLNPRSFVVLEEKKSADKIS